MGGNDDSCMNHHRYERFFTPNNLHNYFGEMLTTLSGFSYPVPNHAVMKVYNENNLRAGSVSGTNNSSFLAKILKTNALFYLIRVKSKIPSANQIPHFVLLSCVPSFNWLCIDIDTNLQHVGFPFLLPDVSWAQWNRHEVHFGKALLLQASNSTQFNVQLQLMYWLEMKLFLCEPKMEFFAEEQFDIKGIAVFAFLVAHIWEAKILIKSQFAQNNNLVKVTWLSHLGILIEVKDYIGTDNQRRASFRTQIGDVPQGTINFTRYFDNTCCILSSGSSCQTKTCHDALFSWKDTASHCYKTHGATLPYIMKRSEQEQLIQFLSRRKTPMEAAFIGLTRGPRTQVKICPSYFHKLQYFCSPQYCLPVTFSVLRPVMLFLF